MKKLTFSFGEKNQLTKDQMKKINGGYRYCVIYPKAGEGCATAPYAQDFSEFESDCEAEEYLNNEYCYNGYAECCDHVDCGCHGGV
jgi:hypothetical protein